MKNRLLPITITFIFIIIFIVFYKGLKDTNIYTPESKINNEVPSLVVDLFDGGKTVNTIETVSYTHLTLPTKRIV